VRPAASAARRIDSGHHVRYTFGAMATDSRFRDALQPWAGVGKKRAARLLLAVQIYRRLSMARLAVAAQVPLWYAAACIVSSRAVA